MTELSNYYIIKRQGLPEVYLRVIEAKKLLESDKVVTIQEAVDEAGISRSSFYKYKDMISPLFESERGKVITLSLEIDDEPGLLSRVLHEVACYKANILTIHQSIPINGIASLTISIEVLALTGNIEELISSTEQLKGIHRIKILARE